MENRHAERIWGLDILRLLAAFAVVALHVNPQAHLDVAIPPRMGRHEPLHRPVLLERSVVLHDKRWFPPQFFEQAA